MKQAQQQSPADDSRKPITRRGRGRQRYLSVRSELRAEPDVHKLARAVVALAIAEAEAIEASGLSEAAYREVVARCHDELACSEPLFSRSQAGRRHPDCPCPRCTSARASLRSPGAVADVK